ncbi:MAG TPA: asparagine synthase (glutamine-hydrolyzing) [Edaphobacter sp.]|nr:asparagine synthase (glutamine-hydrolyzing) [Edaphobacter sp.]
MCGIAGCLRSSAENFPDSQLFEKILDSLKNRGPDGYGIWTGAQKQVALLHRRLAIQDLTETGAQPMCSNDGQLTISFNGEIYNVDELRRWVPDYHFQGTSDTEVILALYQKLGSNMLGYLRGMFAFAIWDEHKQGLLLARDPYGIKPLYIAETSKGTWFSSSVKSLLQIPGIDLSPEPAGHTGFFLWGSIPEPYTLYRGIRSLQSGYSLWLQKGHEPQLKQFVSIAELMTSGTSLPSEEMPLQRLQSALRDSVHAHFISDVPVAIFLSAGLDSSTILGISAGDFPPQGLRSLTLGFDAYRNTSNDETVEASQIAARYGVPQQIEWVRQLDFKSESTRFLDAMDQPTIDGINTYFVARMARNAGFKVALSGLGGDELFGGYGSFRQLPKIMDLVHGLHISRRFGGIIRKSTENLLKRVTSPKYAGLLEYGGDIEGAYLLRRSLFMPWELPSVLDPQLAATGLEILNHTACEELQALKEWPLHLQISFLESTRYMRNQLLRDADWAGMAHSVEIRTPFVDQFLLKQLSPLLGSDTPPTKLQMAQTLIKPLPTAILNRKKTGFSVPTREWLAESLPKKPERGLRSWAKFVYKNQWSQSLKTEDHFNTRAMAS